MRIGTSLPIRGIGDIDAVPSWKNAFSFSHRDHGTALENGGGVEHGGGSRRLSDRTTENDAGTVTTPASHPVESVGQATAADQSPVILADHASPINDCSIRYEVGFQERVARSRREGNDYSATDIFPDHLALLKLSHKASAADLVW